MQHGSQNFDSNIQAHRRHTFRSWTAALHNTTSQPWNFGKYNKTKWIKRKQQQQFIWIKIMGYFGNCSNYSSRVRFKILAPVFCYCCCCCFCCCILFRLYGWSFYLPAYRTASDGASLIIMCISTWNEFLFFWHLLWFSFCIGFSINTWGHGVCNTRSDVNDIASACEQETTPNLCEAGNHVNSTLQRTQGRLKWFNDIFD